MESPAIPGQFNEAIEEILVNQRNILIDRIKELN